MSNINESCHLSISFVTNCHVWLSHVTHESVDCVTSSTATHRGDRTSNNYDCQKFQQVFTGVPVHIKHVFSGLPKISNSFSFSRGCTESPSLKRSTRKSGRSNIISKSDLFRERLAVLTACCVLCIQPNMWSRIARVNKRLFDLSATEQETIRLVCCVADQLSTEQMYRRRLLLMQTTCSVLCITTNLLSYAVASVSRVDKIIGLFCKRAL